MLIDSFILEAYFLFVFEYFKIWSPYRNWSPDWPKVAKVLLVQAYLVKSNSSSWKTKALNSGIKFSVDPFILLHDAHTEESLVLFLRLAWFSPSKSPWTTFFSQKFFSNHFFSIYHLCADWREKIAVRLHLLFLIYLKLFTWCNWVFGSMKKWLLQKRSANFSLQKKIWRQQTWFNSYKLKSFTCNKYFSFGKHMTFFYNLCNFLNANKNFGRKYRNKM